MISMLKKRCELRLADGYRQTVADSTDTASYRANSIVALRERGPSYLLAQVIGKNLFDVGTDG